MTSSDPDAFARRLAAESTADGPAGWFERLYVAAEDGRTQVPWDRGAPHPLLTEWADHNALAGPGRAMVVGSGPGSDSEFVASLGFDTVAFDVSPTAIDAARRRHPDSEVDYAAADLLDLPTPWLDGFDLVVESMTVQSMPVDFHAAAIDAVAGLVALGGRLLVIASAREESEPADGPPWPLTRAEVERFADGPLSAEQTELHPVPQNPSAHRWLAVFRR
ncbi:class I SAM-dependent methyltransferase [Solicola gregarius]|uniref:Class I SAM-dependent methyltransferase n=1 Tax=Solicola gregarius TaxID=2908642 RepID=A0AA46YK58_9ACTN|nr:methyltransferase domain-containing protein [Solicola gregarius]UYM05127.1 class I SAM-dependent methyltransferase [Solicola gregarius]